MNRQQRERLSQFVGITGADNSLATRCLEAAGWSVESAIEMYYSNGMSAKAGRASAPRVDKCAPAVLTPRQSALAVVALQAWRHA